MNAIAHPHPLPGELCRSRVDYDDGARERDRKSTRLNSSHR